MLVHAVTADTLIEGTQVVTVITLRIGFTTEINTDTNAIFTTVFGTRISVIAVGFDLAAPLRACWLENTGSVLAYIGGAKVVTIVANSGSAGANTSQALVILGAGVSIRAKSRVVDMDAANRRIADIVGTNVTVLTVRR